MKFNKILNESGLSRLYRKYKDYDSGTISACRYGYNKKENKERTYRLKTDLIKKLFKHLNISNYTYSIKYFIVKIYINVLKKFIFLYLEKIYLISFYFSIYVVFAFFYNIFKY